MGFIVYAKVRIFTAKPAENESDFTYRQTRSMKQSIKMIQEVQIPRKYHKYIFIFIYLF